MKSAPLPANCARAVFISILVLFAHLSCGRDEGPSVSGTRIAVSIYPVGDIARTIAGGRMRIFCAVPRGANPHTFEPLPSVAKSLQNSRLFIGLHPEFDGWVEKYLKEGTKISYLLNRGYRGNPHIWLSIEGGRGIARHIAGRLSTLDPDGARIYRENLSSFEKQLTELDARIRNMFRGLPDRKLIQWHPSWDLFASEYGLEIVDTIEKGHGREPTLGEFNRLVQAARERKVGVIVIDLKVQSKAATALARESGVALLRLDAIGDRDDPAANSYIPLMENNARLLARALSEGHSAR